MTMNEETNKDIEEDLLHAEDGKKEGHENQKSSEELEEVSAETSDETSEVNKIKNERDELKDKLIRALAENENIRKRYEKQRRETEVYAITKMARDILSVFDNLQRALDLADSTLDEKSLPMIEGLELTRKDLLETFRKNKIDKVDPIVGEKFDPKIHQAIFEGKSEEVEKGEIMQVISTGFLINDRLLRPANVAVSSGKIDKNENNDGDSPGEKDNSVD